MKLFTTPVKSSTLSKLFHNFRAHVLFRSITNFQHESLKITENKKDTQILQSILPQKTKPMFLYIKNIKTQTGSISGEGEKEVRGGCWEVEGEKEGEGVAGREMERKSERGDNFSIYSAFF